MSGGEGYERRWISEDKAVFFESNIRNEQCWKVSLPGLLVSKLDEAIKGPVCEFLEMGTSLSRVDACVDVYGTEVVPKIKEAISHLNEYGMLKPSGDSVRGRGLNRGWTEYIGSRKSERFVRVYDKGAKENSEPNYWLRYEAVLKGRHAAACVPLLTPDADWPQLARGLAATTGDDLKALAPQIHELLFQGLLSPLTIEQKRKSLDGFVANAKRQVFQPLALMAESERMTVLELIQALGLHETKPSERRSAHSPLLSDLRSLLSELDNDPERM